MICGMTIKMGKYILGGIMCHHIGAKCETNEQLIIPTRGVGIQIGSGLDPVSGNVGIVVGNIGVIP